MTTITEIPPRGGGARKRTDPADLPNWRDPASVALLQEWETARRAFRGTRGFKEDFSKYLPKHKKERGEDYEYRSRYSEAFNAYKLTIRGLTGLVFAKQPTLGNDVPKVIRDHAENIDGSGTHLNVFARRLFLDALKVGCAGIFIDYPERPVGATAKDELEGFLRPYWIAIHAEDILSCQYARLGARQELTQFVYRFVRSKKMGKFGSTDVTMYRVYRKDVDGALGINAPVKWEEWEERENEGTRGQRTVEIVQTGKTGTLTTKKGQPLSRIPFVPILLGEPTSEFTAEPPLQDLLELMIAHFQVNSERRWNMHLASVPIPVRKGYKAPPNRAPSQVAASNVLIDLPADTPHESGASFGWAEIQGTAFEATATELAKLKAEMGASGMAFLAPSTRAAETADARRLDRSVENANLSTCAGDFDDAIENALVVHAEYEGETIPTPNASGGSFSTNRDFEQTILDAAMIKVYSELQLRDQLSLETFHHILVRGRALPDGFNAVEEARQILLLASNRQANEGVDGDDPSDDADDETSDDDANPSENA